MRLNTFYLSFLFCLFLFGCGKDSPQPDKPDPATSKAVTAIEVDSKEMILKPGQKLTLSYTVLPSDAANKDVVITSSNVEVITASGKELTAVKIGKAVITLTNKASSVSTTINVEVVPQDASELKLNKSELTLFVGEKETLEATIIPEDATEKELVWQSKDTKIATVSSDGEIEAMGVGETEITVTTKDGKVSAKAKVIVKPVTAQSIEFAQAEIVMAIGSTATISATVLPENTTDKSLVWTSSQPSVVSVDAKGTVKALKAGTASITAIAKDSKVKNTLKVQVTEDIEHVSGELSFFLRTDQYITIGMQIYMSNVSNKEIILKKVEAYVDGVLAATALSEFTTSIPAQAKDQGVISFSQNLYTSTIDKYPPNWHAKVYFIMNGVNYAITIKDNGSSIQQLQQSSIGINPDWDGENTTEIPPSNRR